jgi:hypothetical protein
MKYHVDRGEAFFPGKPSIYLKGNRMLIRYPAPPSPRRTRSHFGISVLAALAAVGALAWALYVFGYVQGSQFALRVTQP